ncbi:hypothetical protein FQA39_LY16676 [Lamprigera yunnana]|nr:hypothetical protein FQA39_LY16676 [Lamprigera yunnana]
MSTSEIRNKLEKATEQLKTNPYYEKYATKIAVLQETSPKEFLNRIETYDQQKSPQQQLEGSRQYSSLLKPKGRLSNDAVVKEESLDKIMKVELVEDKDASDISKMWSDYHKNKDFISATVPSNTFEDMKKNAKKYPIFLFPIPRSQGYEFMLCQFFHNTIHFTPLLNYQVHKENAPECLTIVHYTEFKDSKGIVLMRGGFDKNVLNSQEAQCLAYQLQLYYSQNIPEKLKLLEQFTMKPDEFKHMDLIKQIENLNIVQK